MSDFVDYAKALMESAKGFAEKGRTEIDLARQQAYRRAALLHGFSFLEAHLNEVADHFDGRAILTIHEQGILLEREVRLKDGEFRLSNTPRFSRLTDKIDLILHKFGDDASTLKGGWYSSLVQATKTRNSIVHPKEIRDLQHAEILSALTAILECTDTLYRVAFSKGLPYVGKAIDGGFEF